MDCTVKKYSDEFERRFLERELNKYTDKKEITELAEINFNTRRYKHDVKHQGIDGRPRYEISLVHYKWNNKNLMIIVEKIAECSLALVTAFFKR